MFDVADILRVVNSYFAYYPEEDGAILRLGQTLCNEFDVVDADVFYEEREAYALIKFIEKYGKV